MKTDILVNVFDTITNRLQVTLKATHPDERNFCADWDVALTKVQEEHPMDWTADDVKDLLKGMGWTIETTYPLEVSY